MPDDIEAPIVFRLDKYARDRDWLSDAWESLPDRWGEVIRRRLDGETHGRIGDTYDLTRERIRQIQVKAERTLVNDQELFAPALPETIKTILMNKMAVPDAELDALLPTRATTARESLFRQLGAVRPRTWSGDLPGSWTRHPGALDIALRKLGNLAPMTDEERLQATVEIGIPDHVPVFDLLQAPGSKLTRHALGWIRTSRWGRDVAYLWLRDQGEPRSVSDVARATGNTSEHAIRETMRRDKDFAQVRPEGTWALADWHLPGADNRYTSAVDVVVEVLREQGPLNYDALCAESQRRYPVSSWRITQCLSSDLVGLNADGLYDLAERGATPIEDPEPKRPRTIQAQGNVVGIELNVDDEMLRGSGLQVSRWLTWRLGLRTAPSAKHFALDGDFGTMTVKRMTSSSQISSLRTVALSMGLVDGCKLVVLMHLGTESATVRHICQDGLCPAT